MLLERLGFAKMLESALERYKTALDALSSEEDTEQISLEDKVLEVLLARDSVQAVLDERSIPTVGCISLLKEQDDRLKSYRSKICKIKQLESWRKLVNPPQTAWWWFLEPPSIFPWLEKSHPFLDQFDWFWKFITLITFAISLTFILNTLQRVLASGLDATGLVPVAIQTILVLASGSTLTQQGHEILGNILTSFRIPKHYWQELSAVLSILFLMIVVGIHNLYLPQLASSFYQNGLNLYDSDNNSGYIGSAMSAHQQAIAVQPDYAEARYQLGRIYERLQQADKAIQEYQQVIQSDLGDLSLLAELRARNNLGRLYILKAKYLEAWEVLHVGLNLIKEDTQITDDILHEQYSLLKNLGWLRLDEKHYIEAEEFLKGAINLDSIRASAYCLQAQILEGTNREQESLPYWNNCIRYAVNSNPDDALRAAKAKESLKRLLEKKTP